MGLRNQLSRLNKVADAVGHEEVEDFFHLMHEHSGNPKVFAAIEDLSRLKTVMLTGSATGEVPCCFAGAWTGSKKPWASAGARIAGGFSFDQKHT